MKKYKLKAKDRVGKEFKGYGLIGGDSDNIGAYDCNWLFYDQIGKLFYHTSREDVAKQFTQEEIDSLPHGFVMQYDLIEVREVKYNIACPYTGRILVEYLEDGGSPGWSFPATTEDTPLVKRVFTKREVETKYPLFNNKHYMKEIGED